MQFSESRERQNGFTLIELAIVLVIVGLIVGGVLVGRDVIVSAGVRATITQIANYNTAANTFREKYSFLPGDIQPGPAASFGLATRSGNHGDGDGDGVLQGFYNAASLAANSAGEGADQDGENDNFWVDLSATRMIEGSFTTINSGQIYHQITEFFPPAKIGRGNFIFTWSGGWDDTKNSTNYFGILPVASIASGGGAGILGPTCCGYINPGLTVKEAYAMDKKMDDGYPQLGRVTARDPSFHTHWSNAGFAYSYQPSYTTAVQGTAGTCFDNGNASGNTQQYSVEINDGNNLNCSLSFELQ